MMNKGGLFHLMDIVIAEVPYDDGKSLKTRPALLVTINGKQAAIYKITSKYETKSAAIRRFYYPIKFWHEAGLDKTSYVDLHRAYVLAIDYMIQNPPIGKLTKSDQSDLFEFITNLRKKP